MDPNQPTSTPAPAPANQPAPAAQLSPELLAALDTRLNTFSNTLLQRFAALNPAAAAPAPAAAPAANPAPAPADPGNVATLDKKTLTDRIAFLENERQQAIARETAATRQAAIDRAFGAKNIGPVEKALLQPYLESTFGAGIQVKDGKVSFFSAQTGEQTIDQVLDTVLASDIGKRLTPAPSLPNDASLKPNTGRPAHNGGAHPWLGKTGEEIKKLADSDPVQLNAFLTQHPDEANKMMASLFK